MHAATRSPALESLVPQRCGRPFTITTALGALVGSALSFAPHAHAEPGLNHGVDDQVAWALADCENGSECVVNPDYSLKVIQAEYVDVGLYDVVFDLTKFRGPYNYQVTAVGGVDAYCKTVAPFDVDHFAGVQVACFAPSGEPVDTQFSVFGQYHWTQSVPPGEEDGFLAYTATDLGDFFPYSSAGLNKISTKYNPFGAFTGVYILEHTSGQGAPIVTAKGEDSHRCHPEKIKGSSAGTSIIVRCVDSSGAVVPAHFDITYMHRLLPAFEGVGTPGYPNVLAGAYVMLDPADRSEDVSDPAVQYNNVVDVAVVERSNEGTYTAVLYGLDEGASTMQVVSVGDSKAACRVAELPIATEGGVRVNIVCQDSDGDLLDSGFTLLYQTWHSLYE